MVFYVLGFFGGTFMFRSFYLKCAKGNKNIDYWYVDLQTILSIDRSIILYIVQFHNFKREHSKVWLKMEIITIELLGCGIAEDHVCAQSEISFQVGQPSDPPTSTENIGRCPCRDDTSASSVYTWCELIKDFWTISRTQFWSTWPHQPILH